MDFNSLMVIYFDVLLIYQDTFVFHKLLKNWALSRENLSTGVANNTGADQPARPRSLISAFVIRILKSIIFNLAIGEI